MSYKYRVHEGIVRARTKLRMSLAGITLAVAGLGLAAVPIAAFAYGGSQTNPADCPGGKLVVNVNYTVVNDFDSGVGIPQGWANDTISRHLQLWQVGQNEYCAAVSDNGSFVTFPGTGPAGTGTLDAGITGRMSGGYNTGTFSGSLVADPAYGAKGQLGSFDLMCTDAYTCPGAHPTVSCYVTGWSGNLAWWGWQYKTAQNGTWTNAVDVPGTSQGNITSD